MTAATLTIGPDGVARIEIFLRLNVVVEGLRHADRAAVADDGVRAGAGVVPASRERGELAAVEHRSEPVPTVENPRAPGSEQRDEDPAAPLSAPDEDPVPPALEGGQPTIEHLLERLQFDLDGIEPLPPRIHLEAVPDEVDDLADVLVEPTVEDDDIATADRDAAAPSNDNPGGADDLSPAPLAVDATGTPDRAGIDGDVPTDPGPARVARSKREGRKAATAPRRAVERVLPAPRVPPAARPQRPLPPLPGRPNRELTQAEIDAARAAGRFQRLPAIDERLGQVAIVESVDDAKTQLARLGHKVREIDRNTFKVDARRFDRTSFLQFARTAVRMEAARKKGLVAA